MKKNKLSGSHKCNLVLAGFAKSGTSSLHSYLALHPRIAMSSVKEPHYFSVEKKWKLGPKYHNSLFESAVKKDVVYYGESSTTYSISERAIQRIDDQLRAPKIMFIVREPVERVVSHYRWMFALGLERRPILDAIEQDGFGFDPNSAFQGNFRSYLQFSSYSQYIPRWQERFGEANVLVLRSDELKKNPAGVLNQCFDFLELNPVPFDVEIIENQTVNSLPIVVHPIFKSISRLIPISVKDHLAQSRLVYGMWKTAARSEINQTIPNISPTEMAAIAGMLQNEIEYFKSLSKHLGVVYAR